MNDTDALSLSPRVHIFGGGTVYHVRPHLALSAPAYGQTAHKIHDLLVRFHATYAKLHLTKMATAGKSDLDTNADIAKRVDELIADPRTKMIFMTAALCDFDGSIVDQFADPLETTPSGKDQPRLRTYSRNVHTGEDILYPYTMNLVPSHKIISRIRKERKDIFLVGFKTTAGATEQSQYEAGLTLLKKPVASAPGAPDHPGRPGREGGRSREAQRRGAKARCGRSRQAEERASQVSTVEKLLAAGYREYKSHKATKLYAKWVIGPGDKKLYAINFYEWSKEILGTNTAQFSVEARFYSGGTLSMAERTNFDLNVHLEETFSINDVEAFFVNAYHRLECIPDIFNNE